MSYTYFTLSIRNLLFFSFFILIFGVSSGQAGSKSNEIKEKNITISGITLDPASGKKPESIVVLFHGYGDTAENFIFLAALLGQFLPDTLFVAPDGPKACRTIPSGKQWLSAPKDNKPQLLKEIKNLTGPLNQYLDGLLKKYNLPPEKMVLVGFSQGARIALHIGLRREKCPGIVALSGSYLDDPKAVNLTRAPILILHGVEDKKAPVSLARESHKRLDELKMPVTLILLPGVGHEIDPQAVAIAGEFLADCLAGKIVEKK
jgi:phospholipase/carboxylesterase